MPMLVAAVVCARVCVLGVSVTDLFVCICECVCECGCSGMLIDVRVCLIMWM